MKNIVTNESGNASESGSSSILPGNMGQTPGGFVVVASGGHLSPYAIGSRAALLVSAANLPLCVLEAESRLQNLYLSAPVRHYLLGLLDNLSARPSSALVDSAEETNNETTNQTEEHQSLIDTMKENIAKATAAFGVFLTALVVIAQNLLKGAKPAPVEDAAEEEEEEVEDPKPKPAAKKAAKKAAKGAADDDDLLGTEEEEEEEEEETVTLADLKKAGQACIAAGKADGFKKILKGKGAENLGGLDEGDYPEVLKKLKALAAK